MQKTTLWIIVKNWKILLAMKKRWFWEWYWNWAWWKFEEGETNEECMIRELEEETWLVTKKENLENFWVLHFYFDEKSEWNQDVVLFVINDFKRNPVETEEMRPKWFDLNNIPYSEMWESDKIRMPRILKWDRIEYNFFLRLDWSVREFEEIK